MIEKSERLNVLGLGEQNVQKVKKVKKVQHTFGILLGYIWDAFGILLG